MAKSRDDTEVLIGPCGMWISTPIGLQTTVIKGHRAINAPDTGIVCPLWTPTEEKQGSLGTALEQQLPRATYPKSSPQFTATN